MQLSGSQPIRKNFGFTLIELLISIAVILIIAAGGLAGYLNFNRSQMVLQGAKQIADDLRLAQSLANNQQKPQSSCGILESYFFSRSGNSYTIMPGCSGPAYSGSPVKTSSVLATLTLSGAAQIRFRILRQGVAFTGGNTITVSGFGKTKTVIVEEGGIISVN